MNKRPSEINPIKRYYSKPTRKNSIHAMCSHCMGCTAFEQGGGYSDHLEPSFRTYIRDCSTLGCPLYKFRPFQSPSKPQSQSEQLLLQIGLSGD